MALKNLTVATATIKTSGGDITVRGLSLADVMRLALKNKAAMTALFSKLTAGGGEVSLESSAKLVAALVESAPEIVAEIIAIAADEPEELEAAKRLSFPVQIEALERIGELTFSAEGGPKKVVETVIRVMLGTTNLLDGLQTSPSGYGALGGK